jgi:hypothetical protein
MMLLVYLRDLASAQPQQAALCHRDRAWLALGFFGLLRRSELIALQMRDLQFVHHTSKPHLLVTIRRSKTDNVGAGQQVSLAHKTASGIGIWQLVHTWYQARLDQGASEGDPFLTAWDLDARAMGHKPLRTGEALANRLRAHLQSLKQKYPHLSLNVQSYAMHSLRRGGTVAAWEAGVDRDTIKGHGRWKSEVVSPSQPGCDQVSHSVACPRSTLPLGFVLGLGLGGSLPLWCRQPPGYSLTLRWTDPV